MASSKKEGNIKRPLADEAGPSTRRKSARRMKAMDEASTKREDMLEDEAELALQVSGARLEVGAPKGVRSLNVWIQQKLTLETMAKEQEEQAMQSSDNSSSVSRPIMPTGSSNFDKVIADGLEVIDKTQFIQHFMESNSLVCRILRPRRFGKSTNLNMLKSFLSLGARADDFKRFYVGKNQAFLDKHCGQYPVVFLDLKDCKGASWEEMYANIWVQVEKMVLRHKRELPKFIPSLKTWGINLASDARPKKIIKLQQLLNSLTEALREKYNKEVILLIDEYDTPLNEAARHGFYQEASRFFGTFYSAALRSNDAIEKACLVGILEIKGAGILSGLNNISTYSVQEELFSDHFGFTKQEITQFLNGDEETVNQVMEWYNGYQFGSHSVVNPYSFMQSIDRKRFVKAWIESAASGSLADVLKNIAPAHLAQILTLLPNKDAELDLPRFSTRLDYSGRFWSMNSMLSFLVMTGYLTMRMSKTNASRYLVRIPNEELWQGWSWEMPFIARNNSLIETHAQAQLREALCNPEIDTIEIQKVLQSVIDKCSSLDLMGEHSYRTVIFGALYISFSIDGFKRSKVTTNWVDGDCRYDIALNLVDQKHVIIFELKTASSNESLLEVALLGIDEETQKRDYAVEFEDCKLTHLGIAF